MTVYFLVKYGICACILKEVQAQFFAFLQVRQTKCRAVKSWYNTSKGVLTMNIPYIRSGDYFIPDLKLPEETRPIGKWGRTNNSRYSGS